MREASLQLLMMREASSVVAERVCGYNSPQNARIRFGERAPVLVACRRTLPDKPGLQLLTWALPLLPRQGRSSGEVYAVLHCPREANKFSLELGGMRRVGDVMPESLSYVRFYPCMVQHSRCGGFCRLRLFDRSNTHYFFLN